MTPTYARALSLLALAGCTPADEETSDQRARESSVAAPGPAASEPASETSGATPLTAAELPGEYRVAGVDGADIDLPYGITASITRERIHAVADCVNLEWTYRFENGRLATERVPAESCARGLTPEEEAVARAFDSATAVSRNEANGYEFTGGGHSVVLFTQ